MIEARASIAMKNRSWDLEAIAAVVALLWLAARMSWFEQEWGEGASR
jgi:hypothetical protein